MEQEKQNINQLPKDWKWVKLGEYVKSVKGKKPKSISKEKTNSHSIPYVNIKAFEQGIIDEYANGQGCVLCENGDFLMVWDGSRSGYVGKAIKGALGSTLVKLDFPNIDNNYAYYFLQSKFLDINTRAKGVGIPHVDPNILWNYDLLIPPLPTQTAIVAKIEELFSALDKGIEQLKTAQQQLKTYRQAVLKWAFEGKLTKGLNHDSHDLYDEHDVNLAAEPVADYKTQKNKGNQENPINQGSDNGGLPEGWRWVKTKDVIDIINNGYTPTKEYLSEGNGEIPFIKVYNLNFDGTLNFTKNPTFIPKVIHDKDLKRSICFPGDVLINIVGPPLGKVSIVSNQYPQWNINQAIVMFRPNEKVISKYISYFMQNSVTINWLENTSKATAGQWNVKVSTCREIPFPICAIEEQTQIVQQIESRLSVADKMEESIAQSLQQAEALRQSILKKAFEGKLINTEIAVVRLPKQAKVIPLKRKILAGKIIHILNDDQNFGLTKFQKILYTVEHYMEAGYDTNYLRDTAGPYDKDFTLAFRKEMEEKGWFTEEIKFRKTRFVPGDNVGSLIKEYPAYFREKGKDIVFVIQLLKEKTTHEAELIATLYAVWNNRLIKQLPIKEKELITDFFNWSDKKKEEFQEKEIIATYKWMKEVKLVPKGFGKFI